MSFWKRLNLAFDLVMTTGFVIAATVGIILIVVWDLFMPGWLFFFSVVLYLGLKDLFGKKDTNKYPAPYRKR